MKERLRLRDVELSGRKKLARTELFLALALCLVCSALGYLLPAHRLVEVTSAESWLLNQKGEPSFHSNYADGGLVPLVILPLAAVVVLTLSRRGFGAGIFAAVAGAGGAFLAWRETFLVHLLSKFETAYGDSLYQGGLFLAFVVSVLLLLAEPALFLWERRAETSPPAPTSEAEPR